MRTPEQRIRALELTLLLVTALWIATSISVVLLWRSLRQPGALRARAFVLTDESGSELAALEQRSSGPLLLLRHNRQVLAVGALAPTEIGVSLTVDARPTAALSSDADGSSVVTLYGPDAKSVASIGVSHEQPILSLRGLQADVGMVAGGDVYLKIRDRGRVVFQVPTMEEKSSSAKPK